MDRKNESHRWLMSRWLWWRYCIMVRPTVMGEDRRKNKSREVPKGKDERVGETDDEN